MTPGDPERAAVKYSVVIPARNAMPLIGRCLQALERQTVAREDYEVIVVDDGSTDGTGGAASRHGVRVLTQEPRGPAAARNFGVREAHGAIVLFTDADCEPARDWLEKMIEPFADERVAGVKGAYWSRQHYLAARLVQLEYEAKYRRMKTFAAIDFIDTYAAAFRRDMFEALGGYDESYPNASVEDQEFSFRAATAGYRMVFQPAARVFHQHAATVAHYVRKKFKIGYWKAKLLRRHPEKSLKDAHTPQTLKAQMALADLTVIGLLASLLTDSWWPTALPGAAFLLLTLPDALVNLNLDPTAGLATPIMYFLRSLALSAGLIAGALAEFGRSPAHE